MDGITDFRIGDPFILADGNMQESHKYNIEEMYVL